ncbi:hypothetical protein N9C56_14485 [Paracoccaceae bacterium]|nr:hypothetical protein [Paracoccaceae bacterium]
MILIFNFKKNVWGKKYFCLFFQEKSQSFFERDLVDLPSLRCELGFIDGMHLFEYALQDFINLTRMSTPGALFLFHDVMPWSFEMTTRDHKTLKKSAPWVGDIWKLIPIFIEAGMKDFISVLTSAPSGLIAVTNPGEQLTNNLIEKFDEIFSKWKNIELESFGISNFYQHEVFTSPENFLTYLENINFGSPHKTDKKVWVSQ